MMLTRAGVAHRLRRCIATVRRMEGRELHPSQHANGTHWFDLGKVERVIAERELGRSSCSRRWLDAQFEGRTAAQPRIQNAEDLAQLNAIRDRRHLALISLTAHELSAAPVELLDVVTILNAAEF